MSNRAYAKPMSCLLSILKRLVGEYWYPYAIHATAVIEASCQCHTDKGQGLACDPFQ